MKVIFLLPAIGAVVIASTWIALALDFVILYCTFIGGVWGAILQVPSTSAYALSFLVMSNVQADVPVSAMLLRICSCMATQAFSVRSGMAAILGTVENAYCHRPSSSPWNAFNRAVGKSSACDRGDAAAISNVAKPIQLVFRIVYLFMICVKWLVAWSSVCESYDETMNSGVGSTFLCKT